MRMHSMVVARRWMGQVVAGVCLCGLLITSCAEGSPGSREAGTPTPSGDEQTLDLPGPIMAALREYFAPLGEFNVADSLLDGSSAVVLTSGRSPETTSLLSLSPTREDSWIVEQVVPIPPGPTSTVRIAPLTSGSALYYGGFLGQSHTTLRSLARGEVVAEDRKREGGGAIVPAADRSQVQVLNDSQVVVAFYVNVEGAMLGLAPTDGAVQAAAEEFLAGMRAEDTADLEAFIHPTADEEEFLQQLKDHLEGREILSTETMESGAIRVRLGPEDQPAVLDLWPAPDGGGVSFLTYTYSVLDGA